MDKRCSKCKTIKDISEYCKNKQKSDGLSVWCKDCARESNKRYRERAIGKIIIKLLIIIIIQ